MVDLGISLTDALARMRAHAFARNLTLVEIAHQVIAGTLTGTAWDEED
jgi:AmiR/NasT family two-component response regulator